MTDVSCTPVRKLRIGWDLGGVVCNWVGAVLAALATSGRAVIDPAELDSWDALPRAAGFESSEELYAWVNDYDPCITAKLEALPGALEAMRELAGDGHDVVVITARPESTRAQTLLWLGQHGVPASAVHIVFDKTTVPECDVYVDDAVHNLVALREAFPSALVCQWVQPWNNGKDCGGAEPVDEWPEFVELVREWARDCEDVARVLGLPCPSVLVGDGRGSALPPVDESCYPPGAQTLESGEVRIRNETTGGEKGAKLARFDLLPAGPLAHVAEHYGKGAAKYAAHNWRRGYAWSLSFSALQRHAWAFWNGETFDPETGSHHMAAVAFHALALIQFLEDRPELDDRPHRALEASA